VTLPTTRWRSSTRPTTTVPPLRHQPALDGIRAVAVAGVILFHAGIPWLVGGFLGVEAFFVLSGYLITTLLLSESEDGGRIRLGSFWGRRARRLLPALIALVVVVGCYQVIAGATHAVPNLLGDGLSTMFYVANWHQIWTGGGYFAATGPQSPLQHTWSLAIEEQFYLIWPLVLLAVHRLARRSRTPGVAASRALLTITILGSLLSAAAMAILVRSDGIDRVYFGTDTRASGILVGSALAVVLVRWRRVPRPLPSRPALLAGAAGLAAVLVALVAVHGSSTWFYTGGFLGFDLAVAAVIFSVSVLPASVVGRALGWRPLVALGLISYGVYLWHFPLFLWLTQASTGIAGAGLLVLRVAATLVVATVSYFAVELPIRTRRVKGLLLAVLSPVGAAAAVVSLAVASSIALPSIANASGVRGASVPVAATASATCAATAGSAATARAAGASSSCRSNATLLLGDSLALTLGAGLSTGAGAYGMDVTNKAILGCGYANTGVVLTATGYVAQNTQCSDAFGTWRQEVQALEPRSIVVLLGFWDCFTRQWNGRTVQPGDPAFDAYLSTRIDAMLGELGNGRTPIVLLGVPLTQSAPFADGSPAPQDDAARHRAVNTLLRAAAQRHRGVTYFDLDHVVAPGGHFSAALAGQACRWSDGIHFAGYCGERVGRTLFPELLRLTPSTASAPQAAPAR
jgi:peptidoglycan/LPS O-acetylase OafA/YrhL